tara:strand:- start:178 stop:702 length:525 start_codon:yes stop_codon:yes gene_type:complete
MNAKFPSQQKIFKDDNINNEVLLLKKIINAIRKMRSDLNVHPKIKIDIYCRFEEGLYDNFINNNREIISSLIKSNELHINDGSYDISDCIAVTVDEIKLYIPIKKIIDIDVEKQRLEKNLTNMKNNLKKIESKLDNKSFIEKAPSEIIQSNFNKQKYFKKEIDSLQDLIECLSD